MAHGTRVHALAQRLFVEGASFDEIVDRLGRDGVRVNRKTLMAWAKAENWDSAKKNVLQAVQDKNNSTAVDRWAQFLAGTETLRDDILQTLKELGRPRTVEGGVAALVQLTRMIKELSPRTTVDDDAGEVISTVLDVLFKHPKVGIVLEKYRDEIQAEIAKRLKTGKKNGTNATDRPHREQAQE
jgi:hypothetical protein